jgi:PKD repeat protein
MNKANRKKILPHLIFYKRIAFNCMFLFALTLLTACGGGGGGGSDSGGGTSVNTGTFIDAPVQGLEYQTATQNGTTDNQASFRCEAGEQITFSIGGVVLGTTLCKSIITPLDLVPGAADETDPTVTNILRLLQSLDDDCDLDDTIHITPQIASVVSDHPINFNTSIEDFNNGAIADLFDALNGLGAFTCETPRELRSAEEAQEHFRLVLEEPLGPEELTALFTLSPETLIVLEPVTFDASESTGNITEYVWDFGDGQTGSSVEVSHTYSAAGTYLATLTVIADNDDETSSSREIVVNVPPNQPPIATYTPNPATGMAPLLVTFIPTATDPDGTFIQYFWDFGDGVTITGKITNHTYQEPGTYLTTLTVTDIDGAETVAGPSTNQPPTASFSATPEAGEAVLQVSFNASGSFDPDGAITLYNWNFGDGETNSGVTRNHSYSEAGTYLAKLTVTDNDGATASTTQEIIVFVVDADCSINPCDDNATCDDSGAEIICSCNSGWTGNGFSCSEIECENNDTLPNGGSACGLNNRGEFARRCVNGAWQDNQDVCADLDVCTDASVTDGNTVCGLNDNGTLLQVCETGQWTDSDDCDDPDVCVNDDTLPNGGAACGLNNRGEFAQRCVDGAWQDNQDVCADLDVCTDGSITGGDACGLNGNGTLIQEVCEAGQWTVSDECDDPDVCTNDTTLPNGGSACGLNNRGEFAQMCVDGDWQDNQDVCSDLDVCTDGSVTDGSTVCGLNDNGTLLQECVAGQWTDSDDCDDPDICTNDTTQVGPTACSGGHYNQLCDSGQWNDTTDCILDEDDEDNDLVNAGDDPNDADNTVCGDSDSDGCDDCSVAGIFDPANDGWDENGDGACELPLDYDCMNGANAATDPYRLQACIMFTYVNQDRKLFAAESGNAAPLEWNEDIWEVAIAHSIDMCTRAFFSHYTPPSNANPSQRAAAAGLSYGLAENIAINRDPGAAQYAFMNEGTCSGHRANVLEPRAIEMGIGYHICDNQVYWEDIYLDGAHFVTQDFRWDFSIDVSAYCQVSSNVCQVPPDPASTAECPDYALGDCPTPTASNTDFRYCN